MSRERSARLIVRSKSIMDDKKRILVEAAVEYGGYGLAVRKVPFERLSISYLCAAAGSVLVVMSLIADIVATPLPRRMASASSASVAGLLVVLPLILEIRSEACRMRDKQSTDTPGSGRPTAPPPRDVLGDFLVGLGLVKSEPFR